MSRPDGRAHDEPRPIVITPGFLQSAPSALIELGQTRVLCTAIIEESVPPWMRGQGRGWLTAEYGMLPASTGQRKQRDATKGRLDGRTVEIQRLIGRSLRAVVDLKQLGENTLWIDCDVLEADGGTRCASITGAYVAAHLALARIGRTAALNDSIAAISVGIVDGQPVLDLPYVEDSRADVDMNVVMTGADGLVEVQGTAEGTPFPRADLNSLLDLAGIGMISLRAAQQAAIEAA
ncbi:MAG: ribonuclease PH [Gaiellales bacterium]|jgi:ribonuclease PH|nr:ribonuclease PH [Gaiellales bacterium]